MKILEKLNDMILARETFVADKEKSLFATETCVIQTLSVIETIQGKNIKVHNSSSKVRKVKTRISEPVQPEKAEEPDWEFPNKDQ